MKTSPERPRFQLPVRDSVYYALTLTLGLALVAGFVLVCWATRTAPTPDALRVEREQSRGFITVVTVTEPLKGPYAAQTQPTRLPPLIVAEGPCKQALDRVRDFIDTHPATGSYAFEESARIFPLWRRASAGPDAACSPEITDAFRAQELDPWTRWQVAAHDH